LSLFQREGRLVDFLMQEVDQFSDADVGAAARHVHAGCRTALRSCTKIMPVAEQAEGSQATLETFDAERWKLTGRVATHGPYRGKVVHRGWLATPLELPVRTRGEARVLAPAELEV
jgi:hypothetical protein